MAAGCETRSMFCDVSQKFNFTMSILKLNYLKQRRYRTHVVHEVSASRKRGWLKPQHRILP